jgi:hypothetical protein
LKTRRTTPKVALRTEVEFTEKKGYIEVVATNFINTSPKRKQTAEGVVICIEPESGRQAASEESNTEVAAPKWKQTAEGAVIHIDPESGRLAASEENNTEVATTEKVSTPKGGKQPEQLTEAAYTKSETKKGENRRPTTKSPTETQERIGTSPNPTRKQRSRTEGKNQKLLSPITLGRKLRS